jgi:uncharacterized membrane protein
LIRALSLFIYVGSMENRSHFKRSNAMSDLIVVTFANVEDAKRLRADLRQLEREGVLGLNDAAIIAKDAEGKVHIHDELDKSVVMGALAGGLLGAVLSFVFPLVGLVIGAGGGALVGKSLDMGVDKDFIGDVSNALTPGSSALFVVVSSGSEAAIAAIRPYQGTLYQTTLPSDLEAQLRDALN